MKATQIERCEFYDAAGHLNIVISDDSEAGLAEVQRATPYRRGADDVNFADQRSENAFYGWLCDLIWTDNQ